MPAMLGGATPDHDMCLQAGPGLLRCLCIGTITTSRCNACVLQTNISRLRPSAHARTRCTYTCAVAVLFCGRAAGACLVRRGDRFVQRGFRGVVLSLRAALARTLAGGRDSVCVPALQAHGGRVEDPCCRAEHAQDSARAQDTAEARSPTRAMGRASKRRLSSRAARSGNRF